jgi:hypothetical protein
MVVSSHVPMHQQLASSGSLYIVHVTGRPAGQQLTISTPAPLILHAAPGTPAAGPTPRTSWATTSRWRSGSRRTVPTTALSRRGSRSVIHRRRRRRRLQALKQACLLCCVVLMLTAGVFVCAAAARACRVTPRTWWWSRTRRWHSPRLRRAVERRREQVHLPLPWIPVQQPGQGGPWTGASGKNKPHPFNFL